MKDWPNPFWAGCFIFLAVVLAIVALFAPYQAVVTMAVVAIASNIVSGSLGYISGHKDGAASVSVPSQSSPGSATTVTVGSATIAPQPEVQSSNDAPPVQQ